MIRYSFSILVRGYSHKSSISNRISTSFLLTRNNNNNNIQYINNHSNSNNLNNMGNWYSTTTTTNEDNKTEVEEQEEVEITPVSTDIKKIKIYTKTGDKGTSSLFNGERRSKDDTVFNVLGSLDELSAHIGMAIEFYKLSKNRRLFEKIGELEEIQCLLLDLGSHIATPRTEGASSSMHLARTQFSESHTEKLELAIDEMDKYLPPLKNFILPGGGIESSQFHICRAVCRRTERDMSPLLRESAIDDTASKFINRLSDYFFALSRYTSLVCNHPESIYKLPKERDVDNKYQRKLEVVSNQKKE